MHVAEASAEYVAKLEERFPTDPEGDAAAESLPTDVDEVRALSKQIEEKNYSVPDATSTVKTRGSAQKVFAEAVKKNYGYRCALTGIVTRNFLVASHIVPWSEDQSIRLDPSNGICLSLFVDRAFEKGYLQIMDDRVIRIDWDRVGGDEALRAALEPFEARVLTAPSKEQPNPSYLARRRALVASKGGA
jgi:predicted restriction endonuclease